MTYLDAGRVMWGVVGLVAGCTSEAIFTVSGNSLTVKDQRYLSRPSGYFCDGMAVNQLRILMEDYSPACFKDQKPGDPDPRDPATEHTELDIVFSVGIAHPNLREPFIVMPEASCQLGGGDVIARFYHFAPGAVSPDSTVQASAGTLKIDQLDREKNAQPVRGTFDLTFAGSTVKGSFDALNCDP